MFSPQKKKWYLCDVMLVLANVMVVTIWQHMSVSNQHTVYFKHTESYMSIISQEIWKKIHRGSCSVIPSLNSYYINC